VITRKVDPATAFELGEWLFHFTSRYLDHSRQIKAVVSKSLLNDVAMRWKIDTVRIAAEHIRPAEYAAHLAFWIKKLKPISQAYYLRDVEAAREAGVPVNPSMEIIDINEQAAIRLAFVHLAGCAKKGQVTIHDKASDEFCVLSYDDQMYKASVQSFLSQRLKLGGGSVSDKLIEDMRYRSFDTHHFVHMFDQFIFGLRRDGFKFK
jgi:hypothetical protein